MKQLRHYAPGLFILFLIAAAGWMIYLKLHPKALPSNLVMGVGRMDGDLVRLNAKYPGRILLQRAREGMPIRHGELLTRLDSKEQEAKLDQMRAELEAKKNEYAARKTELAITSKTLPLTLEKARAQLKARRAELKGVASQVGAQEQVVAQDRRDLSRIQNLYERKLLEKEKLEKARLRLSVDRERLQGLAMKREAARTAVDAAKADLQKARALQQRLQALRQSLSALAEGIKALEAGVQQIEAILEQMELRSPLDGYVIEKLAEPGEVVGAGMPVATLIDPKSLYLKIFVDTLQNGRIKLGDKAEIFLDASPDRPIPAKVVRIAQKAEFTPKEVSVRSDRIQRVFAVHLKPLHPDPLLKLGLPATGVISLDGKGLPHSLDELPPL